MSRPKLRASQAALLVAIFVAWQLLTQPGLLPPIVWDNPDRAAFFFGEPVKIFKAIFAWFADGTIYKHLWITLVETVLEDPAIPALTSTWRQTPEGLVAVNYRSSDRLQSPAPALDEFLLYPTPFYPAGGTRTVVRQGSLGADADGDGVADSFRFEFNQVFEGFFDGGEWGGHGKWTVLSGQWSAGVSSRLLLAPLSSCELHWCIFTLDKVHFCVD